MTLLQHESGLAGQPLLEALLDQRSNGAPPAVQEAADRLLRICAPAALDLAPAAAALIRAAGDERTQRLFVTFRLQTAGRSQGQLGQEEGISATRVGQIIQGAERRIRLALTASTGPLPWAVRSLRCHLGGVTTWNDLQAALARLGAGDWPAARLLAWLAGPYLPVPGCPGWLAIQARMIVPRTMASLRADGGVRRLTDVRADLADLEVDGPQLVRWLQASGATVLHDLAVVVGGPLADAVERVLDAHGVPRTAYQIAADLADGGRTVDQPALAAAARQRRFARAGNGAIGLAAWPQAEGAAANPRHPRRRGGARPPGSPPVTKPTPAPAGRPAARAPESAASGAGRVWLRVRVDAEVLRGREAAVPIELMEGLGLAPLMGCTFSSRWGPVTLAYDRPCPTRGSVRAIALAAGAQADDFLFLGLSGSSRDVLVEVRHGPELLDPPEGMSADVALFPEVATGGTR
jgi:hypothetical protein